MSNHIHSSQPATIEVIQNRVIKPVGCVIKHSDEMVNDNKIVVMSEAICQSRKKEDGIVESYINFSIEDDEEEKVESSKAAEMTRVNNSACKGKMAANMNSFYQNNVLKIFIIACWFSINIFLLAWSFRNFKNDDQFNYLYLMCGDYIFIARSFGLIINFNCALILLPMNRFINSWIQTCLLKNIKSTPRRIFDHMKCLHLLSAFAICIASVIHAVCHIFNVFYFHQNYSEVVKEINIADSKEDTTLWNFFLTVPGWTGMIMILVLALIVVTSLKVVRIRYNEIFKLVHYLSILFFISAVFHGFGDVTKYLVNNDTHPKECHSLNSIIDLPQCEEEPRFTHVIPSTWKWIIGPSILHLIDRTIRFFRSLKNCELVEAKIHNGNVIELVFFKNGFKARPGQYVIVQCPEIAEFEWHPFTLTKCPSGKADHEKTFSVHVKVTGDWTGKLLQLITSMSATVGNRNLKRVGNTCIVSLEKSSKATFRIDGPYGSPNQDGFDHRVNVSVAAGIGITPYAAVLNYLKLYDPERVHKNFKLEKLYLIWVCRDVNEFGWVIDLIKDVEKHLHDIKREEMLQCQLYVTQEYKINIISHFKSNNVFASEFQNAKTDSWLQGKLRCGRPDFKEVFFKIASQYEKQKIGLFYCGSKALGKLISDRSAKINVRGNMYIFRKESF